MHTGASILFLGRPGVGKTTAIREVSRMLADECAKRAVIVDTSNEIGGDGDVPHPGIGRARRMQVRVSVLGLGVCTGYEYAVLCDVHHVQSVDRIPLQSTPPRMLWPHMASYAEVAISKD